MSSHLCNQFLHRLGLKLPYDAHIVDNSRHAQQESSSSLDYFPRHNQPKK
jgi:hypothetical protein